MLIPNVLFNHSVSSHENSQILPKGNQNLAEFEFQRIIYFRRNFQLFSIFEKYRESVSTRQTIGKNLTLRVVKLYRYTRRIHRTTHDATNVEFADRAHIAGSGKNK